ncbi:MAG: hypothetical protein CVV64_17410 [Candidatus Wallbacteria bacterium HGW-Wallbacteria-1]|jgi:RHS repeat-associated protein|uniref:Teneurin-like YD-shell domain-containing protein n=1 Tax=Candidatus Wallbacteria bacterium HGW-Wallbacteria-1 TaxID=2013854 RepID=A0A2N1PKA2_9BACT|nr:MAG: hypothetical protein CVV64_17410 [Candidatus Wallbacteria bacterium HGW-Wallbacteria-1]
MGGSLSISVFAEFNGRDKLDQAFTYGPGIDNLISTTRANGNSNNRTSYYLTDALGSVRQVLSQRGKTMNTYSYTPFGEAFNVREAVVQPFRYTGRRWDENVGKQWYRSRHYDAGRGRFAAADKWGGSVGNPIGNHAFGYVNGNPVMYVDPMGFVFFETKYITTDKWIVSNFNDAFKKLTNLPADNKTFYGNAITVANANYSEYKKHEYSITLSPNELTSSTGRNVNSQFANGHFADEGAKTKTSSFINLCTKFSMSANLIAGTLAHELGHAYLYMVERGFVVDIKFWGKLNVAKSKIGYDENNFVIEVFEKPFVQEILKESWQTYFKEWMTLDAKLNPPSKENCGENK